MRFLGFLLCGTIVAGFGFSAPAQKLFKDTNVDRQSQVFRSLIADWISTNGNTRSVDQLQGSASPTPTPTNLPLQNFSFEEAPHSPECHQVSDDLCDVMTDWTVGGTGAIHSIMEGATDGTYSAAFNVGSRPSGTTLSQTFFTSVGQVYKIAFDAAIFGVPSSTMHLNVRVANAADGSLLDETVAPTPSFSYNPAAVPWQRYQFTFTADTTVTTVQFSDIGLASPNADVVLDTVSIVPLPPSFSEWQALHFTQAEQTDPNISGWSADPDRDGIPNGFEYFFHTDPKAGIPYSEHDSLPHVAVESAGPLQYLTFTYQRLIGWGGDPEVVCVSDDLVTWDETESQIEQIGNPEPGGDGVTETVTVRLKIPINQGSIPRKFLRLKLTN